MAMAMSSVSASAPASIPTTTPPFMSSGMSNTMSNTMSSGMSSGMSDSLLDSSFDSYPSSLSHSPVVGITPDLLPALNRLHDAAVIIIGRPPSEGENVALRKALLVEDATLAIHYAAEFRLHQGRVCVFFVNNSPSGWTQFTATVSTTESLGIKKQDPATTLSPGEEVRMQLIVECLRPFDDSPLLEVSFLSAQCTHTYTLRLPITPAAFFDPIVTDRETYMARWKALEADNTEAQEIFTVPGAITVETMARVKNVIIPALHIGLAGGLDSDVTCTGCCSFRTGTVNAQGQPIAVGAMVRIEADVGQQRYRVTARAKHGTTSAALKNQLKSILSNC
jgi:hypothetical protein